MKSPNCSCDGIIGTKEEHSYTSSHTVLVGPDNTALHTCCEEGECRVEFDKTERTFIVAKPDSIYVYRYKIPDDGKPFSWDDHIHFMGDIRPFICKQISRRAHMRSLIVNILEFNSNVLTIDHKKGRSKVSLSFGSGREGEYMRVELLD